MLSKRWVKLSACKIDIIDSILNASQNWIAVKLFGKNNVRMLSGADLINTRFDNLFFQTYSAEFSIDTSWLIYAPDKESKNEVMGILKYQSSLKPRFFFPIRSSLIKNEDEWISKIINSRPKVKIYARYEGDDVLVFESSDGEATTCPR